MPEQLPPCPPSRRPRWSFIGLGILVVLLAVIGGFLLGQDRGQDDDAAAPAPSISTTPPESPGPDVQLCTVAGVELPFSVLHGPRITTDGRAAGYSHSEIGAAIAAVQVLARTSPSAGSDVFQPVLASQVTGTNLAAMKLANYDEYNRLRATTPVEDGAPIPGNDATVAGYVVHQYNEGTATIDVILSSAGLSSSGQLVSFRVALVWEGDWHVIAPANGDWGTASTTLGDPPAGMQRYAP